MRIKKILGIVLIIFTTCIFVECKKNNTKNNTTGNPTTNSANTANTFQTGTYRLTNFWILTQSPSGNNFQFFWPYESKLNVSGPSVTFYFDTQNWSTSFMSGTINGNTITLNPFLYTNQNGTKSSMLSPSINLLTDGTIDYIYTAQLKTSQGVVTANTVVKVNFKKL